MTSPTTTVADDHLALALRLADGAGEVARRYFRQDLTVEQKSDASPVTVADREAETVMRALIADSFPDHGIVGEEFGAQTKEARFVWVLDPIDGTKRFITGNPLFGCLIALLDDGQPVLGVIDMPILEERWIGAAGRGTIHQDRRGHRQVGTRSCRALDQATLYATSPQMFEGADLDGFEAVRRQTRQTSYGGECYSYGLLASGFVDLVIEADMGVYDFLPLVSVVTGAGGIMTDWQGQPLGLHSDGRVIAAGDQRVHAAALAGLTPG